MNRNRGCHLHRGKAGGIRSLPRRLEALATRLISTGSADLTLRRLWIAGLVLLGLQLIAMIAWSTVIWSHFSLTMDYVQYHTAWWLIGHGDLNPISAFIGGHRFWQNNFEQIMALTSPSHNGSSGSAQTLHFLVYLVVKFQAGLLKDLQQTFVSVFATKEIPKLRSNQNLLFQIKQSL